MSEQEAQQKLWKVVSDEYREDASFAIVLAESAEEAREKVRQEEQLLGIMVRTYQLTDIEEVVFNEADIFWF